MKYTLIFLLSLGINSLFAQERSMNYCIGEGGLYSSEEKSVGEFYIDDVRKEIQVTFNKSQQAIYSIESDTTSSSYRPGEQLLRGVLIRGTTPFGIKESMHITVWIPNTSYYGQNDGSMSFSPESSKYSNTVAGFVLMDCERK